MEMALEAWAGPRTGMGAAAAWGRGTAVTRMGKAGGGGLAGSRAASPADKRSVLLVPQGGKERKGAGQG